MEGSPSIAEMFSHIHYLRLNSGGLTRLRIAKRQQRIRRGAQRDTRPSTVNIECLCSWSASRT
jgi:hypothetical protein